MTMSEPEIKKTIWQAEASNPESCEILRSALREVRDPELGLDIIQLGMVRDVEMKGSQVFIKMILTTPFCPYAPTMLEAARIKASQALNQPVQVELGDEPWDRAMMEDGAGFDWGIY
jgi:metal-sulfur cluster biosynthetic enzyme